MKDSISITSCTPAGSWTFEWACRAGQIVCPPCRSDKGVKPCHPRTACQETALSTNSDCSKTAISAHHGMHACEGSASVAFSVPEEWNNENV